MKNTFYRLIKAPKSELKYQYLRRLKPSKYGVFLEKEYKKRTGERLDLDNPKKYTEKMQYAKLYLNNSLKTNLSDKYLVREWVGNKIGKNYLIPSLGVYNSFSEINFEKLPSRFVLKTNHSSGWNLVCMDKDELNFKEEKIKFDCWLDKNFAFNGDIQLHYKNITPKIVAEKFIQDSKAQLIDYRFICFDGEIYYCWVDGYLEGNHYSDIYNLKWDLLPWRFEPMKNFPEKVNRPENLNEMVEIVSKLAEGFSHVRVDLYNVDGKIYFGEMTFTSTGGFRLIEPEKYNYELGKLWDLNINDMYK